MNEQTLKQWKRRALAAEEQVKLLQNKFELNAQNELQLMKENSVLRVALREVQDATDWAYGAIAEKLKD